MADNQEEILDMDGDGKISKTESNIATDRFKNRRRMAWLSMIAMVTFTAVLMSPVVGVEKIKALEGVFGAFYFAMASVVGAYMGFTTWANKS